MKKHGLKRFSPKVAAISSALFLFGCVSEGGIFDKALYDPIDRELELTRDDYRNMTAPKADEVEDVPVTVEKGPVPLPQVAKILAAPKPPAIGKTKLVSLTVTDDVPLKDVLLELARLAEVDLELGSGIRGGISFIARDKPFSDVIARISDLAGLRYSIKNGVLRVERDTPYVKNYSLDFLNIVRESTSDVSLATDVLSVTASDADGGEGVTTGTSTSISSTNTSDFWEALEASVTEILNTAASGEDSSDADSGAGGATGTTFYVINRQAGILSVSASQRQHAQVDEYLKLLKRNSTAQVLIEAKILEVELSDQYQSGIDWTSSIGNFDLSVNMPASITNGATIGVLGPGFSPTGIGAENATGDNNLGINLDALVEFTEQFGVSRTLSSPRLHAINNQQAVLTFAENQVFFEVEVEREDDEIVDGTVIAGSTSVETTRRAVPIGIVLNILPSINLDDQEVTLSVRPTLTRQTDSVTDPGSAIINADLPSDLQFTNEVPIIEVRELDSVMKVRSGHVMVIGGLMEEAGINSDAGVPFFSEVPFLGNAFKQSTKTTAKRELIIFIKATIVSDDGNHHKVDEKLYQKFSDDPRPLVF